MLYDATVIGLGPSGTVAAHRAAARGLRVLGIDPAGPNAPGTIGVWADQIPGWFPDAGIAAEFRPWVIADGVRRRLRSRYVVLAPKWEKRLGGFPVLRGSAPLSKRLPAAHTFISVPESTLSARQLAHGFIITTDREPDAVLMDFSPVPGFGDAPSTFSYRIPLGGGHWLIEETILATTDPPDELLPLLERKCLARMAMLGITGRIAGTEIVDFPLGPGVVPRDRRGGRVHIGGAAGWMHPATGYSVGEVLAATDGMLDRVLAGRRPRPAAWHLNHFLQRRGLAVLLRLSPAQTRRFFSVVLALGEDDLRAYLTGSDPVRTAGVMLRIFLRVAKKAPGTALAVLRAFPRAIAWGARD
ncbi:lycopene cyclase family protein [Corynebacterium pacaense]|uniref:lycopene cyclase family protein n=1 Tax=Corynebacterium pacaense TaxID=1816684 RepID=UPI0009B9AB51|nr:lycopene cyclase family protein [Corynebacterium pacaense]